jgi:uncharacterized protein YecT (DUF1311 family)
MNHKKYLKFLFSVVVLFTSANTTATEPPTTLQFKRAATFLGISDPSLIQLKLVTGEIINTNYEGIEFDQLYHWERKNSKHKLIVSYSSDNGVEVLEPLSGIKFSLSGVIDKHPIDLAEEDCSASGITLHMEACKQLQLKAWDMELNRSYQALGGAKNLELRAAQRAWLAFRDAQIQYMQSHYNRSGSIWGTVYISRIVDLTRSQTNRLKSLKHW